MVSVFVAAADGCKCKPCIYHLNLSQKPFVYAPFEVTIERRRSRRAEVVERAALSPTFDDGVLERYAAFMTYVQMY